MLDTGVSSRTVVVVSISSVHFSSDEVDCDAVTSPDVFSDVVLSGSMVDIHFSAGVVLPESVAVKSSSSIAVVFVDRRISSSDGVEPASSVSLTVKSDNVVVALLSSNSASFPSVTVSVDISESLSPCPFSVVLNVRVLGVFVIGAECCVVLFSPIVVEAVTVEVILVEGSLSSGVVEPYISASVVGASSVVSKLGGVILGGAAEERLDESGELVTVCAVLPFDVKS